MNQLTPLGIGILCLSAGSIIGYYARQSIVQKRAGTIEQKLKQKISQAKEQSDKILSDAKKSAFRVKEKTRKETETRRHEILESGRLLLKRENVLDEKLSDFDLQKKDFQRKVERLKEIKNGIDQLKEKAVERLEKVAQLSKKEAKGELLKSIEMEYQKEALEKMQKLERDGQEKFDKRAKEILALVIQRCALNQAQEITTSTLALPSEDLKGRIIGKEGRNIRTLEKLTGAEVIIDETPEMLVISSFDPVRRQIAKKALERLMADGRIQPARIEKEVEKAKSEIVSQIKEAGETACYDAGVLGLDPQLINLLGI